MEIGIKIWHTVPNQFNRPSQGRKELYAMSKKVLPSQRMFKLFEEQVLLGELGLSEMIRRGAQVMIQHAVELEMTEFLGREHYQNDPELTAERGRRNGYEDRTVLTGEGNIKIKMPQARDLPEGAPRFKSNFLDAYVRRTESLEDLITRMYVTGMSTRDIETTFIDVLEGKGISRSTVSRVTECLSEDLKKFQSRPLDKENVLYLFLDGTYVKYRVEAERKEPVLAAYGIKEDGRKVFLHVGPGNRESAENWKTFLQEMTRRGLKTPLMVITDGNPGVIKAIGEVFPLALRQRCQRHKMNNILGKAPKEAADLLKNEIHQSFHAETYEEGLRIGKEIIKKFRSRFPAAMACLEEDLEACLQALKLPKAHHKRIRTTNLQERLFGENRRRVKVIPHFFSENAGMKLIYATILAASRNWRGARMDRFIDGEIDKLWKKVFKKARQEMWAA